VGYFPIQLVYETVLCCTIFSCSYFCILHQTILSCLVLDGILLFLLQLLLLLLLYVFILHPYESTVLLLVLFKLFKFFSWLLLVINDYAMFSQFFYIKFSGCLLISCFIHTICHLFSPLTKNDPCRSLLLYTISHLLYYLQSFYLLVHRNFDYVFCHPEIFIFVNGLLCAGSRLNIPPYFFCYKSHKILSIVICI
jgi:hypothetical protein